MVLQLDRLRTRLATPDSAVSAADMVLYGLPFRAEREISCEQEQQLEAGEYAVVPFTHVSGVEGKFQLRIWTSEPATVQQVSQLRHVCTHILAYL